MGDTSAAIRILRSQINNMELNLQEYIESRQNWEVRLADRIAQIDRTTAEIDGLTEAIDILIASAEDNEGTDTGEPISEPEVEMTPDEVEEAAAAESIEGE